MKIAALYVRSDSIYKTLPHVDAWDEERDARGWPGGTPLVAHPPCAQWGRLRGLSTRNLPVKSLAVLAVRAVRQWGGVLEHPIYSTLWAACALPRPGQIDQWGGFTLPILQQWFGHKAEKATWLYVCGITPAQLPEIPLVLGEASHVIGTRLRFSRGNTPRPEVPRKEREETPPALAEFLCEIARRTRTLPPMPDSGATKPSPRESAEPGGPQSS